MNLEYRSVMAVGVAERRGYSDEDLRAIRFEALKPTVERFESMFAEIDAFIHGDATEDADILAVASVVQPVGMD